MKLLILIGLFQSLDTIEIHYGDPKYFDLPDSIEYELKTDLNNGYYVAYDTSWNGDAFLKFAGGLLDKRRIGRWEYYQSPIYGLGHVLERDEEFELGFWKRTTEYFQDGSPRWRFEYPQKAINEADWIEERMWHENGQLKFRVFIPKGGQRYKQESYYENGKLKFEGYFDEQERTTGVWTHYYENGQIEKIGEYCNECLNENLRPFFYGIPIGEWKYFSEDGELLKTEDHKSPMKDER